MPHLLGPENSLLFDNMNLVAPRSPEEFVAQARADRSCRWFPQKIYCELIQAYGRSVGATTAFEPDLDNVRLEYADGQVAHVAVELFHTGRRLPIEAANQVLDADDLLVLGAVFC